MKKLLSLSLLLSIAICINGQTVQIKVNNGETTSQLNIEVPINGYVAKWGLNSIEYTLDSEKFNSLEFNTDKGGLFVFKAAGVQFSLLLFPEDEVTIELFVSATDYYFDVKGTNKVGHQFWLEYNRPRYKKALPVLARFDQEKSADNILPIITSHIDSVTHIIANMEKRGEITNTFYNALSCYIKDELGGFLIEYVEKRWRNNWHKTKPMYLAYLNYMNAYTMEYAPFKMETLDWYSSLVYEKENNPNNYDKILNMYGYMKKLPTEIKECRIANIIYFHASRGYDDINWKEVHEYYIQNFPNSKFTPHLNKALLPYYELSNIDKSTMIFYIDASKNYEDINDLIKTNFSGKAVFIDLWATWCGPCKSEFVHNEDLHNVLKKYNVEMLYISIDDEKSDDAWKKFVNNGMLKGYHYRANKKVYDDIQEKLFKASNLAIPRYIFIGPNGKILDPNMPRPSSKELLYNRINQLITN